MKEKRFFVELDSGWILTHMGPFHKHRIKRAGGYGRSRRAVVRYNCIRVLEATSETTSGLVMHYRCSKCYQVASKQITLLYELKNAPLSLSARLQDVT